MGRILNLWLCFVLPQDTACTELLVQMFFSAEVTPIISFASLVVTRMPSYHSCDAHVPRKLGNSMHLFHLPQH